MKRLFCDCKTDEEKANFFLSGRAVETGIIAPAISNDVAMAYHRCAEFQKEIDTLRAKIEAMGRQKPASPVPATGYSNQFPLYALPGAQPAPSVPDGWKLVPMVSTHEMKEAGACAGAVYYAIAKDVWSAMLAAAPEARP